jgi:Right handed beta helix region
MVGRDLRPEGPRHLGRRRATALAVLAVAAVAALAAGCSTSSVTTARTTTTVSRPHTPTTTPGPSAAPVLQGGSTPVPAPTGKTVSPPASVAANCSVDVSGPLKRWLRSLPAGQTVVGSPNACYLVNEGIRLKDPKGLTIYGATFMDKETAPIKSAKSKGNPVFTVIGGSDVTFEALHIVGANTVGYHSGLAFAGGIELEGTAGATIRGVTISHVFGDGITLAPLRGGANFNSDVIVAPASSVTIRDVTVSHVGRQGITFASVKGVNVSDVIVNHPGQDTFDFEADQWNEGAKNVTIDGCEAKAGGYFFANAGTSYGHRTGSITVEHCSMDRAEGGTAILVERPRTGSAQRGPFVFKNDTLYCGASDYVSCVQVTGGDVTVADSSLGFPGGTVHEPVYHASAGAHVTFDGDVVAGYGLLGKKTGKKAVVQVVGGHWKPWADSRG